MDRAEKGQRILDEAFGGKLGNAGLAFDEFNQLTKGYLFGEVWSRPGLALKDRSLVTVAVLCAGDKERHLAGHLKGALNFGHSPDELKEVVIHESNGLEDQALVASVQKGIESRGYDRGQLLITPQITPQSEHAVAFFQSTYLERMGVES